MSFEMLNERSMPGAAAGNKWRDNSFLTFRNGPSFYTNKKSKEIQKKCLKNYLNTMLTSHNQINEMKILNCTYLLTYNIYINY